MALDPATLTVLDSCVLPEPSIARISAQGDEVYVVGDTSLLRVSWQGGRFVPDDGFRATYRTMEGQSYGWDCVLALGAAWFLDDGDGTIGFDGSFEGRGVATAPLHLVRVDLTTAAVTLTEVCGLPGGLIANPPLIDVERSSPSPTTAATGSWRPSTSPPTGRWPRNGGGGRTTPPTWCCFPVRESSSPATTTGGGPVEQVVALDIATGEELVRADTEGPLQSTVFPSVGHDGTVYWCSMSSVSRVRFG